MKTFTLYANYGTSFTPADLDQLFDPTYGNTDLTPANADTIEGGIRARQFDGVLTENITFWHSYVDNVITYDATIPNPRIIYGPPFGAYGNAEAERSQGVEFETAIQITPHLTLNGNYTYTDAASRIPAVCGMP